MMSWKFCQGFSQICTMMIGALYPNQKSSASTISSPSQNPGTAMKRTESVRTSASAQPFGRIALRMPTGSPTSHEMIRARIAISAESGPRWRMRSRTVSPRKNDLPSSPVAMSRIQRTYCTGSESDRPRSRMSTTRSAGAILACPSTPRMATSGSPGRMRSTTKMIRETQIRVPRAKNALRSRYFCTRVRGLGLRHPDLVPAHHVVDPEVLARVLATHAVVPGIVDLLVRDRDQRRVALEDVLRLPDHGLALVIVHLPLDVPGEGVELLVGPARVVLRAVLAIPGGEVIGRVHQRGHDGADGQVEVARGRLLEPLGDLDHADVGLDVEVLLQHRLDGHRPELEGVGLAHQEIEVLEALAIAGRLHQLLGFLDRGLRVLLIAEPLLELRLRGGGLVERIHEAADLHGGGG